MNTFLWILISTGFAQPESPPPEWKLVWEDGFERAELGSDWFLRRGKAKIVEGRLFLSGSGATILVDRGFAPDVKIEFAAEANPKMPPCDLSAALCSSNFWGYHYLLAFGGNNNQLNQILGGSERAVDHKPPFLIEHGKKYRITALKEGRRLALSVNGRQVLEGEDSDPVGGPGFDRVGLVTWNGMYVDWVKVYERNPPAPDGPVIIRAMPDLGYRWKNRKLSHEGEREQELKPGIDAYNTRKFRDAFEHFSKISPPALESVAGLAYVVGDLAYQERPGDQDQLAALAHEVARNSPENLRAHTFAQGAEWFRRITLRSRDRRAATRLVMAGPRNNPFYYKADLYHARYHYASALEGGDRVRRREAVEIFQELKRTWPEHAALRELTGERVEWGEELIHPESAGPSWARHLQECFARQHAILNWWFTERQSPDGQLGGGWGDDVEILRDWIPVSSISTAGKTALDGIERMAEGVWRSVLRDGYSPGIGDVEHSAEPSADALPGMILLRYGDPRFTEFNLRSAKTIRETFLGINRRGRLQFRSAEFGTDGVNSHHRAGGDTGYHARALRHFVWLAWYGIPEAKEVFLDWCRNWREVTMEEIGTKPSGFVPASIFFPSGGIHPPDGRPWYDEGAHYYGFPGITRKIHESFLTAYWLSGDRGFLDPVETMLDQSCAGPLAIYDSRLPPDDPKNLLAHISHQAQRDVLAVHRWLTDQRVHDEYINARGSPTQRYWIDGNFEEYAKRFERIAEGLRQGWALQTSEVLQTDRAGLPGSADVFGAYTGAIRDFSDTGTLTLAATWKSGDIDFAAVVTDASASRLRVRLYRFGEEASRLGLRPWRLQSGRYALLAGEILRDPRGGPDRYLWQPPVEVEHRHRGAPIWIEVPPGKEWMVDLRLREPLERPAQLPDLALAVRDVRLVKSAVLVTVHNIGGAAAGEFSIALQSREDGAWKELARKELEGLPAIKNFNPVVREVEIPVQNLNPENEYRILLDPDERIDEICEANNEAPLVQ